MYSTKDYIELRKKQILTHKLSSSLIASLVGFNGSKNCDNRSVQLFTDSYLKRKKTSKKKRDKLVLAEALENWDKVTRFVSDTFFV